MEEAGDNSIQMTVYSKALKKLQDRLENIVVPEEFKIKLKEVDDMK